MARKGRNPAQLRSVLGSGLALIALLAIAHTRLGLASIELGEERDRLLQRALLGVTAVFALAMSAAVFTMLIVIVFWDTWRVQVLVGFLVLYGGFGLWCVARLRALSHTAPALLEQTLAELERDIETLRR